MDAITEKKRFAKQASVVTITCVSLMLLAKFYAWWVTGSVTMEVTLLDSVSDLTVSSLNLWMVGYALRPADKEHRFGHGKLEAVAALFQVFIIGSAGLFIIAQAIGKLARPTAVQYSDIGAGVAIFSLLLTLVLVLYQRALIKKLQSLAVKADSVHYTSDLAMNGACLLTFLLGDYFDLTFLDPVIAILIAIYMCSSLYCILRKSLDILMDRELPKKERALIRRTILGHPEVKGIHDLRTRFSGTFKFIQFHMEVKNDMMLSKAHNVAHEVENMIKAKIPMVEIIVHQDLTCDDEFQIKKP